MRQPSSYRTLRRPVETRPHRSICAKRIAVIERHVGVRGRRILDCGCGAGDYVLALSRLGADAWGVEFSRAKLASAAATLAGRVSVGDLHDIAFRDATVDGALMNEVLRARPGRSTRASRSLQGPEARRRAADLLAEPAISLRNPRSLLQRVHSANPTLRATDSVRAPSPSDDRAGFLGAQLLAGRASTTGASCRISHYSHRLRVADVRGHLQSSTSGHRSHERAAEEDIGFVGRSAFPTHVWRISSDRGTEGWTMSREYIEYDRASL